jgi:hypothetical protein
VVNLSSVGQTSPMGVNSYCKDWPLCNLNKNNETDVLAIKVRLKYVLFINEQWVFQTRPPIHTLVAGAAFQCRLSRL